MEVVGFERKQYNKLKYNRYIRKTVIMETVQGWTFLSPLLVTALIFSTSAIGIGLWLTFQGGQSINELKWVGLSNWKLLDNPALHLDVAFKNTFLYAIVSVPAIIIISLIISAILNSKWIKNKELFLGILFLPQVTSAIASTLIFKQLFSANGFFKIDYVAQPELVIYVVVISATWGGVAANLITLNTAFAAIDRTIYEAAELDGANGFKKFIRITIPSISPIIAYSLVMGIIGGLGVFDGPYLMAATAGVDIENSMTIMLKGFSKIQPLIGKGGTANIGLGTTILFMLAMVMGATTILANWLMPLSRRSN